MLGVAMHHASSAPPPELAPFVRSLWVQEEAAFPDAEPTVLLPVGHATLVLEYGDPFEVVDEHGVATRLPAALLVGPFSRPVRVRARGRTGLVLVPFRAAGAAALLPGAGRCAEAFVPLEELVPAPDVRRLSARLGEAPGPDERRGVVEGFLRERLANAELDACLAAAIARIERGGGSEPVAALAEGLGTGRRQLVRRFAEGLGLAPKVFARIVRFQRALERACAGVPWSVVAARGGFADQAHLAHECQALAGRAPRALLAALDGREVGRRFRAEPDGPFATYL